MFLDMLSSAFTDDQPATRPTAKSIQENIPEFLVRDKDAEGEPSIEEAFARAGDPCSVCHDDFQFKEKVVELPCSHVRVELVSRYLVLWTAGSSSQH